MITTNRTYPWSSMTQTLRNACAKLADLSSCRAEIFQIIQDLSIFIPIQWYKYLILHVQNIFWDSHILQYSQWSIVTFYHLLIRLPVYRSIVSNVNKNKMNLCQVVFISVLVSNLTLLEQISCATTETLSCFDDVQLLLKQSICARNHTYRKL